MPVYIILYISLFWLLSVFRIIDSDEGNTGSGQDSQLVIDKLYRRTRHVTQRWAQIKTKVFEWERMLDNMVEVGLKGWDRIALTATNLIVVTASWNIY